MDKIHFISPASLDYAKIIEIIEGDYTLELSEEAKQRIVKCRTYLDNKMQNQKEPIYGITTGFGALCDHTISNDQLAELQKNLVISHACGTGEEVDPEVIRLMLFLKVHALSLGHSGVQLETVQRLVDFYNLKIYPVVYRLGSLGASGDLAPLAHLVMPILGLGQVRFEGKLYEASEILNRFSLSPIGLKSKEGLALLNGTQFMSAHGVRVLLKAFKLSKIADIVAAISLDAFDGRIDAFDALIQQIRPHAGQIETAQNIRKILEGSELTSRFKKHVQDPYSFRCIPQVHGASKDAIRYVASVLKTEINSVTDNPTIFPDEDLIISGGNFHGQPLAIAFDLLSIAMAELGSISERRVYRLISGWRNLPEFLVANPGLNSGFMIPQYAAASIVSQNKQLCTPNSVDSIPSSNEQEDHVSMGANGATKALRVVDNLERILAIELFNAAQALEFRKPLKTSPYLQKFIAEYRKVVDFVKEDKIMYKEINATIKFIQAGKFDF